MVYNTTQQPPPPQPHTVCIYILYVYFGKGWEGWGRSERRKRGSSSKEGSKIPKDWLYLQSIISIKHQ
jgi:hypothetical protein